MPDNTDKKVNFTEQCIRPVGIKGVTSPDNERNNNVKKGKPMTPRDFS